MIDPDDLPAVEDLVLQRTGPFIAMAGKGALREWTTTGSREALRAALTDPDLRARFVAEAMAEIERDADDFAALVGPARRRLVSVGVGSGIAEARLCRALRVESILLVDIERGGHGHGYGPNGAGYASLRAAKGRLRAAGVAAEVLTWNPSKARAPEFEFDALVSILAMGFHFPADAYRPFIRRNAAPGAVVAYDFREAAGLPPRRVVRRVGA